MRALERIIAKQKKANKTVTKQPLTALLKVALQRLLAKVARKHNVLVLTHLHTVISVRQVVVCWIKPKGLYRLKNNKEGRKPSFFMGVSFYGHSR